MPVLWISRIARQRQSRRRAPCATPPRMPTLRLPMDDRGKGGRGLWTTQNEDSLSGAPGAVMTYAACTIAR